MKKGIIRSTKAPAPIGPYSQAVRVGETLYISGQIPIKPDTGEIIKDDIARATEQVMINIKSILNEAGMDFVNVVKCSIFVTDMNDFPVVNSSYGKFFTSDPPARETVEVCALPKDVNVEISCIAVS